MADKKDGATEEKLQPIIVKKIKKGGGHHGGAWKVAYADFVTAMMAFFLLLWLLNVTTDEQKAGIAEYFDPNPRISESKSGAGGLLGGLTIAPEGAQLRDATPVVPPESQLDAALRPGESPRTQAELAEERREEEQRKREEAEFEKAEEALRQAIDASPELAELSKHLIVDMTPEGLRIQIVDQEGASMFPSGSAQMYERTRALIAKVGDVIKDMPNQVSVRGHTDSVPYRGAGGYSNWELSTDRANASRRVLLETGLPEARLNNVLGKADTDHLLPDQPKDARNRRISIILLHESLTTKEGAAKSSEATKRKERVQPSLFRRSQGTVEFP
jgi:chemotaxis protein MotB